MSKSKVLGFLPLIAALCILTSPLQAKCYKVETDGPDQCNCTAAPAKASVCTSSTITAAGSIGGGLEVGGPGLKAGVGGSYSQEVSTGATSCMEQIVESGKCIFLRYRSTCCVTFVKVKGFFLSKYVMDVQCTYDGYDLLSKDGCA